MIWPVWGVSPLHSSHLYSVLSASAGVTVVNDAGVDDDDFPPGNETHVYSNLHQLTNVSILDDEST